MGRLPVPWFQFSLSFLLFHHADIAYGVEHNFFLLIWKKVIKSTTSERFWNVCSIKSNFWLHAHSEGEKYYYIYGLCCVFNDDRSILNGLNMSYMSVRHIFEVEQHQQQNDGESRKKIPISIFEKHMDIYVRYCLLFFICCFPFFPSISLSLSLSQIVQRVFFLSSFVSSGLLFSLIRHRRQRQQHHHYFNAFIDSVSIPIIVGIFH